jgi:hypothetical protein
MSAARCTHKMIYVKNIYDANNLLSETQKQTNSVVLVRKQTIPAERPPHIGEVSANFCG